MFSRKKEGIGAIFKSKTILLALAFLLLFGLLVEAEDVQINKEENKSEEIEEIKEIEIEEECNQKEKKETKEIENEIEENEKVDEKTKKIKEEKGENETELKKIEENKKNTGNEEGNKCNIENRPGLEKVLINEIFPSPSEGDEWIELYNFGEEDVLLEGCFLADENLYKKDYEDNDEKYASFKKGFKINSNEYKIIFNQTKNEINNKFIMNKTDEKVYFLNSEGKILDKVFYKGKAKEDYFYALNSNGEWEWTDFLTFEKPNKFKTYSERLEITELIPNPEGADDGREWVEVLNNDDKKVNLTGWSIANHLDEEIELKNIPEILSGKRIKIEIVSNSSFLRNSKGSVKIKNPSGEVVDKVEYFESAKENFSYSKNLKGVWEWTEFLTPGEVNRFPEPKIYSRKVEMTELMPNPEGADKNKEWIELFNRDEKELDLESWYFFNQSDKKIKLDGLKIKSQERLKVEIKNSSFSIKNSDGWIELRNPNDETVDRVSYLESAKMNASYNKNIQGKWEWSIFVTPGKENRFNHPPTYRVDIPNKIYEDVKMAFKIEKVRDKDGENLKFRWDFGDDKRSYLKETSHTFDKRGRYTIQTRVSDLSADVFKYFNIEVQKFPEFDLEIVKLLPNPKGSDSENEKIWILNKEKRVVNLKGWSITTGSSMSKLTNHYFREDFKIKAGDIEEIGRKDCPFSLLNKKGRVVLKSPNGEIVDKIKYEKDKIEDDQIYYLENGEWFWSTSKTELTEKDTNLFVLGDSNKNENDLKRRNINLLKSIFDEEVYDGSDKLIYFNNWLFGQSQGYFFEFIFPDIFIERVNFWKAN
jgi:hypothetical protein